MCLSLLWSSSLSSTELRLLFTSVGDDGLVGTATSYDFRGFTDLADTSDWESGLQISLFQLPKLSGQPETLLVSVPDGLYHWFIKAVDEVGNSGPASNMLSTGISAPINFSWDE